MIPLIIITVYLLLLLVISYLSTKRIQKQSADSFLLAGKNLTWPLVGVLIAGLGLGGASTVGVAESAYTYGLAAGWYDLAWAIGAVVFALVMAKKVKRSKIATIIQTIEISYGKVPGFFVMIVQMIVGFAIFTMQIVAGGALLASLLPDVFSISSGMLISTVIFCLVAIIGGMWSAALSNIINVIAIIFGMLLGAIAIVSYFGGISAIEATLPPSDIWFSFTKGYGPTKILSQVISLIVLAVCIQTCTQTAASSKSEGHAKKGFLFAALLMAPVGFISALLGVVAASKIPNLESPTQALPMIITYLNPWLAGIVLSGLWAADVSTGNGMLIGQSSMITSDIVKRYFVPNMNEKTQVWVSRIAMALLCILGYFFALNLRGIISTLMKLLTLWTPLAVLVLLTWGCPQLTRKSTGSLVMIGGGLFGVLSLFVPALVIADQAIFGTTIVSLLMWVLSLVIDKKPSAAMDLYHSADAE